jgi:Putative peptidoglycan binding domain
MRNKLLVSTAVLAAAIAVASCEKTPSEEPGTNQNGSSISERQQSQSTAGQQRGTEEPVQQTQPPSDAQQHSTQTANQPAAGGNEQPSKEGQREQDAGVAQDRNSNTEDNQDRSNSSRGQTSRQDRTSGPSQNSVQSDRDGLAGQARQTEPQQKQPQLQEQNKQAGPNQRASGTEGALNLGRDQVRQAQMVLKEKGFDAGEADGVLGPRTRKALIAFQRQQGLEPSGEIDQRTATALGISKGPGSTTGHSGAGAQ